MAEKREAHFAGRIGAKRRLFSVPGLRKGGNISEGTYAEMAFTLTRLRATTSRWFS
jgi:hypothetical protein